MGENHHIILFSALDWGLGHTTRSIPILTHLNNTNAQLIIAVQPQSASEKILQRHFPHAIYVPLPGYGITYSKKKRFFSLKIFLQIPKILKAIRKERRFVNQIIKTYPVQLIISDNRYGFYHPSVPSVFITHQLRIAAPLPVIENWIQRINYRYINHFSQLWIPDFKGTPNLAGKLSHPARLPEKCKAHYIGPLSRLTETTLPTPVVQDNESATEASFKYLFLLSGPEPARSILEKRLLEAAAELKAKSILVRGLPAEAKKTDGVIEAEQRPDGLKVIHYADPALLGRLIKSVDFIICRSGYSTVMDLILLGKKGIYIPTPGQTEQEYLAKHLMDQHWGFCFNQDEPNYKARFDQAEDYTYQLPSIEKENLAQILEPLIESGGF